MVIKVNNTTFLRWETVKGWQMPSDNTVIVTFIDGNDVTFRNEDAKMFLSQALVFAQQETDAFNINAANIEAVKKQMETQQSIITPVKMRQTNGTILK